MALREFFGDFVFKAVKNGSAWIIFNLNQVQSTHFIELLFSFIHTNPIMAFNKLLDMKCHFKERMNFGT